VNYSRDLKGNSIFEGTLLGSSLFCFIMTSKFKLYERIVLDNIEFTITNISVIPQCAQYIDKKFVYLFDFNYSLSYGDYKMELTETEINNLIKNNKVNKN
jgi:hypothetical protein